MARKLEKSVSRQVIGDRVAKIKMMREGKLLVEVRGDKAALGVGKVELIRVAGETAKVSELQQFAKVEVRDIDGWSSSDVIALAIIENPGWTLSGSSITGSRLAHGLT